MEMKKVVKHIYTKSSDISVVMTQMKIPLKHVVTIY